MNRPVHNYILVIGKTGDGGFWGRTCLIFSALWGYFKIKGFWY